MAETVPDHQRDGIPQEITSFTDKIRLACLRNGQEVAAPLPTYTYMCYL